MKRPLLSTVAIVAVLIGFGLPFLGVNWARPGDWVLAVNADARAVTHELETQFSADPAKTMTSVVELPEPATTTGSQAALIEYTHRLDTMQGIKSATVTG